MLDFPKAVSMTVTNRCNLRCHMCGQWGDEGYMNRPGMRISSIPLETWENLADQIADKGVYYTVLRGGEPLLYPGVFELIRYLKDKKLKVSMDTNGTLFSQYAEEIVESGLDNITLSIDGSEALHDEVRGVAGTYRRIKEGVKKIKSIEKIRGKESIIRSLNFTISPYSYRGLSELPDAARELDISEIAIVPYYFLDRKSGMAYEKRMLERLRIRAQSWKGFHRESSGVSENEFIDQYREFLKNLGEIKVIPFMPLSEEEYVQWFSDCTTVVGLKTCMNPWRLIDIQPNGDVNFCIDFPDCIIGNILTDSIENIWNSGMAEKFRAEIKNGLFPPCIRCGAKYMTKFDD